jgi:hypothetical protein
MAQLGVLGPGPARALPILPESLRIYVAEGTTGESANAAIVQTMFAALDANDRAQFLSSVADDTLLDDLTHPQCVGSRRGVDAWFTAWTSAVSDVRSTITSIVGIDRFVLIERAVEGTLAGTLGRVTASNAPFTIHQAMIAEVKAERMTRISIFSNGQELARAVGQWPPR